MVRHSAAAPAVSVSRSLRRLCAIGSIVAIGAICGCAPPPSPKPVPPAPVLRPLPSATQPTHPLLGDRTGFLRLGNMEPGRTPLRIGVLLPFSSGSATTRSLASSMMKAAAMALFDRKNPDLVLISADEGSGGQAAIAGAQMLMAQGAEVIVGPLFAQSVSAVAPFTRDHGVPLISFSTDRGIAGDGVYLLSFQPENEVQRIVRYAAAQGHSAFAALIPATVYGAHVAQAFQESVKTAAGHVVGMERFTPASGDIAAPAQKVAQSHPDAILIAQGGTLLVNIAPTLAADGAGNQRVQYLGTGLWDDPATLRETSLAGGWFAAPDPDAKRNFDARFRAAYGASPQALASLAYDAVSLVSVLASGTPYHRFTAQALTDPNGFSGVDGIFRFDPDGTSEHGLAVLSIRPGGGATILSPAPTTFLGSAS
jgi:branched-chain amino acid transport system substrate-binding protein